MLSAAGYWANHNHNIMTLMQAESWSVSTSVMIELWMVQFQRVEETHYLYLSDIVGCCHLSMEKLCFPDELHKKTIEKWQVMAFFCCCYCCCFISNSQDKILFEFLLFGFGLFKNLFQLVWYKIRPDIVLILLTFAIRI